MKAFSTFCILLFSIVVYAQPSSGNRGKIIVSGLYVPGKPMFEKPEAYSKSKFQFSNVADAFFSPFDSDIETKLEATKSVNVTLETPKGFEGNWIYLKNNGSFQLPTGDLSKNSNFSLLQEFVCASPLPDEDESGTLSFIFNMENSSTTLSVKPTTVGPCTIQLIMKDKNGKESKTTYEGPFFSGLATGKHKFLINKIDNQLYFGVNNRSIIDLEPVLNEKVKFITIESKNWNETQPLNLYFGDMVSGSSVNNFADLLSKGEFNSNAIRFYSSFPTIRPESIATLNALVQAIKAQNIGFLKITAYTNDLNNHSDDQELSAERANFIATYIKENCNCKIKISTQGKSGKDLNLKISTLAGYWNSNQILFSTNK